MQTLYEFSTITKYRKDTAVALLSRRNFWIKKKLVYTRHIVLKYPYQAMNVMYLCVTNFAKYLTKGFHLSKMFQDILSISAFDFWGTVLVIIVRRILAVVGKFSYFSHGS